MNEHGPHHPPVRSEEDRISTGTIVAVGVVSLLVFFVASVVAASYLRMRQGEHPSLPIPTEVGRSKIGMVEQQMYNHAMRGERDRAARRERLRSYGWVDRRQGVVHIPVERAMELVAAGARPAPGAEAPPPPGGQP